MAMAASVACVSSPTSTTHPSPSVSTITTRIERPGPQEVRPLIDFLIQHFVPEEPILASLQISNKKELTILLEDLVLDCVGCGGTVLARDIETREVVGCCLASKHHLFEKQMDRLCRYSFTDERLSIAVEFLKYVFNRVDVAYHLEENRVTKPVFIALLAVRADAQQRGIGKKMLQASLDNSRDIDRCDSAFTVCSSESGRMLLANQFQNVMSRIRYRDYRGEYRDPPINPEGSQVLHLLLARL